MPVISIKAHHKNDPLPAFPLEPGVKLIDLGHAPLKISLLECGMESGAHAVGISFPDGNGNEIFIQTSLALWEQCSGAFKGWQERWAQGL